MSMSNMGSLTIKMMLFFVLQLWFIQYVSPRKTFEQRQIKHSRRNLVSDSDFMNIDCGAPKDYYDNYKRYFDTDTKYISTGEVSQVSSEYLTTDLWPQFKYLRSFPKGKRNCYALPLKQGKNVNYLITALFKYGNYDNKSTFPEFDLYIGVNRWRTLNTIETIFSDVIYLATTDSVELCLVNTDSGTPFISALQLRPLVSDSFYQTSPGNLLRLIHRYDCGRTPVESTVTRYDDDVYDRIWRNSFRVNNTISSWTSSRSDFINGYDEQPPSTVLKTYYKPAQQGTWMRYIFNNIAESISEFAVYLHFAEILQSPQQRRFTVDINSHLQGPFNSPKYMNTTYLYRKYSATGVQINISATDDSKLSPILNALEIFMVVPIPDSPSNQEDATAMMEIKRTYGISEESWQGDPCVPTNFTWSRLNCSSDKPPRIISLNLSSSGLTGGITASLSNLKSVRVLDLSDNKLTGSIPESLAELSSLEILNLAGNKLKGSVPKALLEKLNTGALNLSLHENPKLCFPAPCKHKKNKVIVFVVIAVASVLFIALVILLLTRFGKWNGRLVNRLFTKKMSSKRKVGGERFRHSAIKHITKKSTSFIGEGGFGKVYRGELKGTQVAVKVLSELSRQGAKEFKNELQLLSDVKHENVVSLIGYCNKGTMALVYEYMANGNLEQHIRADNTKVLTWKERLRIALDAAQGLIYLHDHQKPPIIHRDLKTTNILLNDQLQAKISDFGISKLFSIEGNKSHVTTGPKGTSGYLDPEYNTTKHLNTRSDIYSFGVILLELITGKAAVMKDPPYILLTQWIAQMDNIESIIDKRLQAGTYNIDSVRKTIETAKGCVKETKSQRPDISKVYSELEDAWKIEMGSSIEITP